MKEALSVEDTLKLALDFIIATNKSSQFWLVPESNLNKTVTAIKEALMSLQDGAQPAAVVEPHMTEQHKQRSVSEHLKERSSDEPVAWGNFKEDGTLVGLSQHQEDQANWVGLTDEEIKINWPNTRFDFSEGVEDVLLFARGIEDLLKEKNT